MSQESVEVEPYQEESISQDWRIQDLSTADWALSRVADLERELEENEEVAKAAIARIEARKQLLNEKVERGLRFFRSHLAAFAQEHRSALLGGGKKKSRSLLHGTLGWKKSGGRLEVRDRAALLEWARLQPVELGFLRITEAPALDEIQRQFKLTGEVPPGTDVQPEVEEVVIKAAMTGESNGSN
jgi:phage host-nuclease inhibitor protein Gam